MSSSSRLDPDDLAALEEQRDFLLASLADLDREHDAGDLTDEDHQTLKDDYTARAADVLRAIEDQKAAFADARRPRSLGKTLAIVVGVALFAVVSGLMVAKALGARKAGDTATGGVEVKQTASQRANECSSMMGTDPAKAYECLEGVLDDDPQNPVALTWSGWLLSLSAGGSGVSDSERAAMQALSAVRLEEAVDADPTYSYARAFRAVVAYRNGRYEDAKQYLEEFEANDPSADARAIIEQQDLATKIDEALAAEGD